MSANTVSANAAVTLRDVAAKAGVPYNVARNCLGSHSTNSQAVIDKVRAAASELNYVKNEKRAAGVSRAYKPRPANKLFASREAETNAMRTLRSEGYTNADIAKKVGVSLMTVCKRIGTQPQELTDASKKLAAKTASAKCKIRAEYHHTRLIGEYNASVEALNAEMLKIQQMMNAVSAMQKHAALASKATGKPLLRIVPPAKAN